MWLVDCGQWVIFCIALVTSISKAENVMNSWWFSEYNRGPKPYELALKMVHCRPHRVRWKTTAVQRKVFGVFVVVVVMGITKRAWKNVSLIHWSATRMRSTRKCPVDYHLPDRFGIRCSCEVCCTGSPKFIDSGRLLNMDHGRVQQFYIRSAF